MKCLMLVLLFHLLLKCSKCNKVIYITSQDQLLQLYLCHHYNYTDDTTLLLLDTVYNISGDESLCNINTNYSLTIQGNHSMATIQCNSSNHVNFVHPTIGFAFNGSSSLTLQRVTFTGCGANLTTLDKDQLDIINSTSSFVYFTQYHAAVLVFTEISHLVMRVVSISQYYGFAIVAVNLPNANLDSVKIIGSQGVEKVAQHKNGHSVGSGALLMYQDSPKPLSYANQYKLTITNSTFSINFDYVAYSGYVCVTDFYNSFIYKDSKKPVINAAGLTIYYIQANISVQVDISQCTFIDNAGSIAGAMLLLHLETKTHSQTVIKYSKFDSNSIIRKCHGRDLVLFFDKLSRSSTNEIYQPLQVIDVHFTFFLINIFRNNQEGAVYIAMMNVKTIPICFTFSNVTFNRNNALLSGSCIFAVSYPSEKNNISFVLESIKAYKNRVSNRKIVSTTFLPASLFKFSDINSIIIKGSIQNPSSFSRNFGTVIQAIRSDITLEGQLLFHNNTGINGGSIMLIGDSLIHLTQGLRANFTNNKALSNGGAIYDLSSPFDKTYCTFQVNIRQYDDIAVLFENNEATVTGNSVFSPKMYNCYMNNYTWVDSTKATEIYNNIFTFLLNNIFQLSTTPVKLTICHSSNSSILNTYDAYPGEKLTFSMAAINAVGKYSYSIVSVAVVRNSDTGFTSDINWYLSERQSTQVIRESDDCTLINITIHTNDNSTLNIPKYGALLFTVPSITNITVVDITLKSCPPGFELNLISGSCICSHLLSSLNILGYTSNCSINTRTFNKPTFTSWVGLMNETSGFLLSLYCHRGYCNGDPDLTVFRYINKDKKFEIFSKDLATTSSLCLYKRKGILCGNCSTNYSVVFGSSECRQCSNWWLWTLVLYAVAGPLLIYLLYTLKLTLTTGTFNGIIFYAQAANVGILDMLSVYNGKMGKVTDVMVVFLSVLNLGLGFPLCFYNGMREIWKAGLSLLFPLYLLTIIVVIIILSRYSLRLSNRIAHSSVQVLVTVVHLSFGKLLGAIINAFTPAKVFSSNQSEVYHVWYWDGSVEYGSKGHIILMIITLLVVFILLLPYVLLLFFAKPLRHCTNANEYTRPILEAIHAPYKNDKQYWFVARLLLLIMMYILYSIEPYQHTIYIVFASILFFFIIGQAIFRPYKSNFINLLDCWLLFNLAFIYITTWYLGNIEVTYYSIVAILLFFITSFVVLVYHILFITGQIKKVDRKVNDICTKISRYLSHKRNYSFQRHHRLPLQDANDSFYNSCHNYREPMLSSS